jgi:hypothetical protein
MDEVYKDLLKQFGTTIVVLGARLIRQARRFVVSRSRDSYIETIAAKRQQKAS